MNTPPSRPFLHALCVFDRLDAPEAQSVICLSVLERAAQAHTHTHHAGFTPVTMEVFLRLKDLHAYGKICESVHKTASANKICKRKRSFAKV